MKLNNYIFLIFLSLILSGCVGKPAPIIQYNYSSEKVIISTPDLNIVSTSYVGDKILSSGYYSENKTLHIKISAEYGIDYIPSGYYRKIGSDEIQDFYSPISTSEYSIPNSGTRQYIKSIAVKKNKSDKICPIHIIAGISCVDAHFDIIKKKSKDDKSFEQALVYNGRIGDKLNIGYREFSNDMARSAFSNNVEYDLNNSNLLSYKGAIIEIINADNSQIKYKVIKSFINQ